jgi:hypothetical protein
MVPVLLPACASGAACFGWVAFSAGCGASVGLRQVSASCSAAVATAMQVDELCSTVSLPLAVLEGLRLGSAGSPTKTTAACRQML